MFPLFSGNYIGLSKKIFDEAQKLLNQSDSLRVSDKESVQAKAEGFIKENNWQVRNIGVKILGKVGDSRHAVLLADLLKDKKQVGFVRRNSAKAIKTIGVINPQIQEALMTGISDGYWEVRVESIKTAAALCAGDEMTAEIIIKRYLGNDYAVNLNGSKPLRLRSKEKNFEVREAIAEALGNFLKYKYAVPALLLLLNDDSWIVRAAALRSLSKLPDGDDKLRKLVEGMNLTCESFRPVFPLKEIFSRIVERKRRD